MVLHVPLMVYLATCSHADHLHLILSSLIGNFNNENRCSKLFGKMYIITSIDPH